MKRLPCRPGDASRQPVKPPLFLSCVDARSRVYDPRDMQPDDAIPSSPFDSYQRIRSHAATTQITQGKLTAAGLSDESAASSHKGAASLDDSTGSEKKKKRKRPSGAQHRKDKKDRYNKTPTTLPPPSDPRTEARVKKLGTSFLRFIQARAWLSPHLSNHASG